MLSFKALSLLLPFDKKMFQLVFKLAQKTHRLVYYITIFDINSQMFVLGIRKYTNWCFITVHNKAFRHVETLFIQSRILVQNKEICEWTGVNLFDYVNSKEVFVQSVYMSKCLITGFYCVYTFVVNFQWSYRISAG